MDSQADFGHGSNRNSGVHPAFKTGIWSGVITVLIPRAFVLLGSLFCLLRAWAAEIPPPLQLSSPLEHQVIQRTTRTEGRILLAGKVAPEITGTNRV